MYLHYFWPRFLRSPLKGGGQFGCVPAGKPCEVACAGPTVCFGHTLRNEWSGVGNGNRLVN